MALNRRLERGLKDSVQFLVKWAFCSSKCDQSLFTRVHGNEILYILVYVDDIIIIGNSST